MTIQKPFERLEPKQVCLPTKRESCVIIANNENKKLIEDQKEYISQLARISDLQILDEIPDVEKFKRYPSMSIPSSGSLVFLITEDVAPDNDSAEKLKKDLVETDIQIERLEKLLASDFAAKAPPASCSKRTRETGNLQANCPKN